MSKELKAPDKVTQKMTRDGAVAENLTTGETTSISERPQEENYAAPATAAAEKAFQHHGRAVMMTRKHASRTAKEPVRKPEPVKEEARTGAEEERKRAEEPLIIQEAGEKRARPGLSELLKRAAKKLFYAARAFCGKIKGILKNGRPFLDFLNDAENREAFSFLLSEGKRLLLRVLPGKLSGTVRFDLEDPASVGKALIFLSFLYPAIGDRVQITPLFENENRLEGELSLEGRIRAVSLLIIGIRVFFDQRVRKLLRRGQKLRRGAGRSL